ncbi:hypothetical protein V3W47_13240 [Deinococcus sp. YIM 134068]|uniref:hypothetical protein n=1 Tax=Deinococcus lichenicola TaxID=3118910 RepID=UPI002F93A805
MRRALTVGALLLAGITVATTPPTFEAVLATLDAGYRIISVPDPDKPLARLRLPDGRQVDLHFAGCAPGPCREVTVVQTLPCSLCDLDDSDLPLPTQAQVEAWNRTRQSTASLGTNSLGDPAVRLSRRLNLRGSTPETQLAWLRAFLTETVVFRAWLSRGGLPPTPRP